MRKILRWIARIALALLLLGILGAGYFLFLDGRAPARRPELVRLPAGTPPAPRGFPTLNALKLSFLLSRLEIIDTDGDIPVPAGVIEERDVEYGRAGDAPLLLDLYRPKTPQAAAAALIFIHGGGWKGGQRQDYKYYTVRFADQGYVVATISYRFSQQATFPGCVEDARCAVRWMRANAVRLQVDPERIAVVGGSAGGYLALMTGFSSDVAEFDGTGGQGQFSSRVAAVVDLYGPADLTTPFARQAPPVVGLLGKPYADDPELYEWASPIRHLDAGDPPTLVIHGTIDDIVPVEQSDHLVERLRELGVPHYYVRIDGWPHTLDANPRVNEYVRGIMAAFFAEHLGAGGRGGYGTMPRSDSRSPMTPP